jgi:hypothetical protein
MKVKLITALVCTLLVAIFSSRDISAQRLSLAKKTDRSMTVERLETATSPTELTAENDNASTASNRDSAAATAESAPKLEQLKRRRDALTKYLQSVAPSSADYRATRDAIESLNAQIVDWKASTEKKAAGGEIVSIAVPTSAGVAESREVHAGLEPGAIFPKPGMPAAVAKTTDFKRSCDEINTLIANDPRTKAVSLVEKYVCATISEIETDKNTNPMANLSRGRDLYRIFIFLLAKKETPDFLVEAEEMRTDKQVGGASTNAGSTSLVVKGGVPSVLGFAVENGGLERTIDGTTITFRGNPVGLVTALQGKGFMESFALAEKDPIVNFLRKTSFGMSFDTSRGADAGVFTGSLQQLSSFNVRVEIQNKRNPNFHKRDWENFLVQRADPLNAQFQASACALTNIAGNTCFSGGAVAGNAGLFKDAALQAWWDQTQTAVKDAVPGGVEKVFKERLALLPVDQLSSQTVDQLRALGNAIGLFQQGREAIFEKIAKARIFTFEYTNKREVNAPDTSNFNLIFEKGTEGRFDLTANASLTIFNSKPSGIDVKRIRDFQFAGQVDKSFGDPEGLGQFTLSFAGKYERLIGDAIALDGTIIPNLKGDIAVGQAKFVIPIKGLGIRFPISVTFANRTELVRETEVRGNFGFTFDLDTLFAKFKPF